MIGVAMRRFLVFRVGDVLEKKKGADELALLSGYLSDLF